MTSLQLYFSAHVAQDEDMYQLLGYRYMDPNECVPITLLKLDADPNIKDNVCLK